MHALDNAVQGAFKVAGQVQTASDSIHSMKSVQLSAVQQLEFADAAWQLIKPDNAVQFEVRSLLKARRAGDVGTDLWTVFNRLQESLIRGGFQYTSVNSNNVVRTVGRRAVKSIDAQVKLNRALWNIAEQYIAK